MPEQNSRYLLRVRTAYFAYELWFVKYGIHCLYRRFIWDCKGDVDVVVSDAMVINHILDNTRISVYDVVCCIDRCQVFFLRHKPHLLLVHDIMHTFLGFRMF
ncbi:hypothetical protein MT325_m168R [Paramecium bursaria chlorella virus MT325]|uniref:Uncharacterized protein m168R n=1 Tax=Paramecium bursaria Chlorella virus MT325 TaxID=346932 RepID=A7ITP8_PBCVM|nr:hypothetical protein MT325_m168R [Paramecium bursaria chlorella virus MT325]